MSLKFIKRWRLLIIYSCIIYFSLPFAPRIWSRLVNSLGEFGENLPILILGLSLAALISWFLLLKKEHWIQGVFIIIFTFVVFFSIANRLELLAEKMHLIEYAIWPFIIYKSINKKQALWVIHVKIFLIGSILGIIDECLQLFIPGRFFDLKDIVLNSTSIGLGQVLLYALMQLS